MAAFVQDEHPDKALDFLEKEPDQFTIHPNIFNKDNMLPYKCKKNSQINHPSVHQVASNQKEQIMIHIFEQHNYCI
jgi:hypothetical protein